MTVEQLKQEVKKRFDKDLTDAEAQAWLEAHPTGELQDEDLARITGGWGSTWGERCPNCGKRGLYKNAALSADGVTFYKCTMCHYVCSADDWNSRRGGVCPYCGNDALFRFSVPRRDGSTYRCAVCMRECTR